MKLDKRIELKKRDLNEAININGIMDIQTIKISQELDVLIVMKMIGQLN